MGLGDLMQRVLRLNHSRDRVFARSKAKVRRADETLHEARRINDLARERIIREHRRIEMAVRQV